LNSVKPVSDTEIIVEMEGKVAAAGDVDTLKAHFASDATYSTWAEKDCEIYHVI